MTSKGILVAAGISVGLLYAAPSWAQHEGHPGMSRAKPASRQPAPRQTKSKPKTQPSKQNPSPHAGMNMNRSGGAGTGSPQPGGHRMPMSHAMPMGQPMAGTQKPVAGHGDMAAHGDMVGDPEHAQATLQSIDQAAGALQDAQQSTDPSRIAAALVRAQRALSQAREHVVMGAQAGAQLPGGQQMPMTATKPAAAKPVAEAHEGHTMPMVKSNGAPNSTPKGDPHAGHQMPMASGMKMGGMKMGGMSMDGMMAMQGMLTESRKHSQAALQSLDELGSALQKARQAPDRPQGAEALSQAERALEAAREHLGRSQYSVETGGDLQRLETAPGTAAPHLGGDHEAAPLPGTTPRANPEPSGSGARPNRGNEAPGHAGHGASNSPAGQVQPNRQPGTGTGGSVELPSLVRGTLGMPGAPALAGTSVERSSNAPANQAPSSTLGRGAGSPGGRTGSGSPGGGTGR